VIEEHLRRASADLPSTPASLPRRIRAWLGMTADPPLPRPRSARIEPVRRSWLAALWQARICVGAGVTLDDYLRSRLARYLATIPVARGRLPLAVDVDDGQLVVQPVAPERTAFAPTREDPDAWLAPLIAAEGPAARHELSELEVKLALLEGAADAARKRTEELSHRLGSDVAAGLVAAPPTVEATAEQLGRPPVRTAGPQGLLFAFAAAAIAAETWQVAMPLLRSADVDPVRLAEELRAKPIEVGFAAIFALGVSAGLFALAHAGLAAAQAIFRGEDDARRRRWLAAGGAGAALLAALVAVAVSWITGVIYTTRAYRSVAALPSTRTAMPPWTLVLLLLALPVATGILLSGARTEAEKRDLELAAALQWDRERARALAERERRLEELSWAEDEERAIERERDAARRRIREIGARAMTATRLAVEAERKERAALARLAHSLVAALEIDRYEYVRQATVRGASELVAARRRKAGADGQRAPLFEAAPVSPAPVAVKVEPGRLAS
jgi:hypothetical protein